MAMAQELSRPFRVVGDLLDDIKLMDHRTGWRKLKLMRKEAYGCGENGERIVDGLDLYVLDDPDVDPDLHSSTLCIAATLGVRSLIGSEIGDDMAEIYGRSIGLSGTICTVAGGVMVLRIYFLASHEMSHFRSYFLVYDSTAATLSMLPGKLPECPDISFPLPLKVQDNCSLLLLATKSTGGTSTCPETFLFTWSPSTIPSHFKGSGWIVRSSISEDAFTSRLVFWYKGNAVWGNLGLGIQYCDCRHLLGRRGLAPVDFKLNMLPKECRAEYQFHGAPLHVYRNMGCVGDSIWFVVIKPSQDCPGETMVNVWTLDLLSEEWKPHSEFKMQTIWELDGFRAHGLPKTVPKFPILRQQDDGILYMLLPIPSSDGGPNARLVGIDLSSSCEVPRLISPSPRHLSIPMWMHQPVVLDSRFFSPCDMAV